MIPRTTVIVALSVTWLTAGCVMSAFKVGAAAEEDRTLYAHAEDSAIKSEIRNKFLDEAMLLHINTDVYERRVLLTGTVTTEREKRRAEDIAGRVHGVKLIFNHIKVADTGGLAATAGDLTLDTKLETRLLFDHGVRWSNVHLRAVDGTVYLLGMARTPAEMDRILKIVSETEGVTRIVNYLELGPRAASTPGVSDSG